MDSQSSEQTKTPKRTPKLPSRKSRLAARLRTIDKSAEHQLRIVQYDIEYAHRRFLASISEA